MSCFIYLDSKRIKKKAGHNGAGPTPIGITISCLKTMVPIAKKHLFMRKQIASTRIFFSEVFSSSSNRNPKHRCFRKTSAFSHFKFK